MAQSTVVYLTDDLDGTDAVETVRFALDGKSFEIDLNKKNAAAVRRALKPYVEAGRSAGRQTSSSGRSSSGTVTAFSKLDSEENDRFRKWAKMPDARRIADTKVEAWIKAGRP